MIESNRIEPGERARPSRICLSLMDRWEIGGLVVPDLFLPVIHSIKVYQQIAPSKEQYQEVMRSGAMFFDGVESHLIWGVIHQSINSALEDKSLKLQEAMDNLELVSFILRTFNVREEEMVIVHAPLVILVLLVLLREVGKGCASELSTRSFALAEDLLELIPQRAFHATQDGDLTTVINDADILPAVKTYYSDRSSSQNLAVPFSANVIGQLLVREISDVVREAISSHQNDSGLRCKLLVHIVKKIPKIEGWNESPLLEAILNNIDQGDVKFATLQGSTHVIAALYGSTYIGKSQVDSLVFPIVKRLWQFLSPDTPKYHVEAVRALWSLQDVFNDRRVEAAISSVMISGDYRGIYKNRSAENGRRFSVLWTHSVGNLKHDYMLTRPLFLFLDSLVEEGTELHIFTRGWLQSLVAIPKYDLSPLAHISLLTYLGYSISM